LTIDNPSIPSGFSNVIGLGTAQDVFPVKKSSKYGSLIFAVFLLGAAALLALGSLIYTFYQVNRLGPAVMERMVRETVVPLSCGGLVTFGLGLLAAWSAFSNWKKTVVVYRDGLAYSDRKGLRQARWDQIASLTSAVTKHYRNGIYTGTTHIYTVLSKEGEKWVFNDSLQNVEALSDHIRKGTFPHLYQAAADAYNAGGSLQFGSVAIDKAGIQLGKKSYQWSEVKQVSIQQGVLKVEKQGGGWFSGANIMVSTIPNLPVLLSIIDQVIGIRTSA
jgi:Family of unknown function (DUF6585)